MSENIHKELSSGRWQTLSLPEQMANIGSEVYRTFKWFNKHDGRFNNTFCRALELFDLTLADLRWNKRKKEIARSRELFCSVFYTKDKTANFEEDINFLNNYFLQFGTLVRLYKERVK